MLAFIQEKNLIFVTNLKPHYYAIFTTIRQPKQQ